MKFNEGLLTGGDPLVWVRDMKYGPFSVVYPPTLNRVFLEPIDEQVVDLEMHIFCVRGDAEHLLSLLVNDVKRIEKQETDNGGIIACEECVYYSNFETQGKTNHFCGRNEDALLEFPAVVIPYPGGCTFGKKRK